MLAFTVHGLLVLLALGPLLVLGSAVPHNKRQDFARGGPKTQTTFLDRVLVVESLLTPQVQSNFTLVDTVAPVVVSGFFLDLSYAVNRSSSQDICFTTVPNLQCSTDQDCPTSVFSTGYNSTFCTACQDGFCACEVECPSPGNCSQDTRLCQQSCVHLEFYSYVGEELQCLAQDFLTSIDINANVCIDTSVLYPNIPCLPAGLHGMLVVNETGSFACGFLDENCTVPIGCGPFDTCLPVCEQDGTIYTEYITLQTPCGTTPTPMPTATPSLTPSATPSATPLLGCAMCSPYTVFAFDVLSATGVTAVGSVILFQDLGVSPATGASITGPITVLGNTYSGPASFATTGQAEALSLASQLSDCACQSTISTDLAGLTLTPGVYCLTSAATITGPTPLTLDFEGDSNAIFIFKVGTSLTTTLSADVIMINGGLAGNIYWLVGTTVNLGTSTTFAGVVVADQSITLNDDNVVVGKLVSLNADVVFSGANCAVSTLNCSSTTPSPSPSPTLSLGCASCSPFALQDVTLMAATHAAASVPITVPGDLILFPGTVADITGPWTVLGNIFTSPSPVAAAAQVEAQALYDQLGACPCEINLTGVPLSGLTVTPGVYCFDFSINILGTLTLDALGDASSIFIFQTDFSMSANLGSVVQLTGGAQACNVFWRIGTIAGFGLGGRFKGIVVAQGDVLFLGKDIEGKVVSLTGGIDAISSPSLLRSCECTTNPIPPITPSPLPTPPPPPPTLPPPPTPPPTPPPPPELFARSSHTQAKPLSVNTPGLNLPQQFSYCKLNLAVYVLLPAELTPLLQFDAHDWILSPYYSTRMLWSQALTVSLNPESSNIVTGVPLHYSTWEDARWGATQVQLNSGGQLLLLQEIECEDPTVQLVGYGQFGYRYVYP